MSLYRNQSTLTQSDIASIMQVGDFSSVSRWENGQRKPNIYALLAYHLLFNIPIEKLLERQKSDLIPKLARQIMERVAQLKKMPPDLTITTRIAFLEAAFTRLASLPS
jgi:transcriptional regulator with XRE-family HTH domain